MKKLVKREQAQVEEATDAERSSSERTCVGCRAKAEPHAFERFVYLEGEGLIFDLRQKAPGRGVYVHARRLCIERAVNRGGFARGLKAALQGVESDKIIAQMCEGIERRLRESLQSAVVAQATVVGASRAAEAVAEDRVRLLLVAGDAGESTRHKYVSNAERKQLHTEEHLGGEFLGRVSGKEFVAVLAITGQDFAQRIARDIGKLRELGAFEG
ncbi:MAG: DUF448 domain-containing protein [Bradymonadaceae bacterium]|nr:DUF448 domain-containing protein [Lujinxingiaceae bacterium]